MSKQTINIGASPNDGTGTPLRTAFDFTNQNFTELYTATGPSGNNIVVPGNATITGDLTVDTSTLKVDSTNNRVGILTATPGAPLDILANSLTDALLIRGNDNANCKIRMVNSGASGEEFSLSVGYPGASNSSFVIRSITASVNRYVADQTGAHFWSTNAGTAMTLNSTGLGINITPSVRLHASDSDNAANGTLRLGSASIYGQIKNSASSTGKVEFTSVGTGVNGGYNFSIEGQNAHRIEASGVFNWFDGAGGTRMTLNSTGLGVGVSPTYNIDVLGATLPTIAVRATSAGASNARLYLECAGTNSGHITYNRSLQALTLGATGGTTAQVTLDSVGNVGVGVTPSAWGVAYKAAQLTYGSLYSQAFTVAGVAANCYNAGAGGWTYFGSGQTASRYEQSSGTHAWYTAVAGTGAIATFTQAMTLDATGNLLVGATTALASGSTFQNLGINRQVLTLKGDTAVSYTSGIWNASTTGDALFQYFATETSLTVRGGISYNRAGGLVAYNTTSDYRAKDIIGPVSNSGSLIDSLKVYVGKMKGATIERPMLIAHEAQEVAPYAVTGLKDEVDADGKDKYQQMDVSSFVPLLIAEIQSLRARVQTLEAR